VIEAKRSGQRSAPFVLYFGCLRQQDAALLLRCPVCALATVRLRCTQTAATRSGRSSCHRQRSPRSPDSHWLRQFKSAQRKKSAIPDGMTDFLSFVSKKELVENRGF